MKMYPQIPKFWWKAESGSEDECYRCCQGVEKAICQ